MVVKKERRDRKWKTNASRKQVRDGVKHLCKKNIWKEDDEGSNDETSEKFSTLSGDLSGFFSKWNCIFEIMQEIPSKFGCAKFSLSVLLNFFPESWVSDHFFPRIRWWIIERSNSIQDGSISNWINYIIVHFISFILVCKRNFQGVIINIRRYPNSKKKNVYCIRWKSKCIKFSWEIVTHPIRKLSKRA